MPAVPSQSISATVKASAGGVGSVQFQNTLVGHVWTVRLLTATSAGLTVTVSRNGVQVIDSTTQDPRPQVTSDSVYDLAQFEKIVVRWTGAASGQSLTATLTYDESWDD